MSIILIIIGVLALAGLVLFLAGGKEESYEPDWTLPETPDYGFPSTKKKVSRAKKAPKKVVKKVAKKAKRK